MNTPLVSSKTICLSNKLSDSNKVAAFLAEYVTANNISEEAHKDLRLAVEETFVNIVSYAFVETELKTGTHTIDIEISTSDNKVSITFTDAGIAFNPLTDYKADLDNDDHCQGGMGISLIKSLTDHQQYARIEQRNVFTLTKHYTK